MKNEQGENGERRLVKNPSLNADMAFALLDREGKVQRVNPTFEDLTGYGEREIKGKRLCDQLGYRHHESKDYSCLKELCPQEFCYWKTKWGRKKMYCDFTYLRDEEGELENIIVFGKEAREVDDEEKDIYPTPHYRLVAEQSSDMISIIDFNGNILYVNQAHERTLGFSKSYLVGKNVFEDLLHPENAPKVKRQFQQAVRAGEGIGGIEAKIKVKEGHYRWIESRVRALRENGGRKGKALVSSRDITEQRKVRKELKKSEARHRSLTEDVMQTSHVGIVILDEELRVAWVNRAYERYFGLDREEIIGMDKEELIETKLQKHVGDPEKFHNKLTAAYRQNEDAECFECHILPDEEHEERWLEHWSQPIRSGLYKGGRIEHYYDITERKRLEETLMESEQRFRSFFENAPIGIFRAAPSGHLLMANPTLLDMLGYPSLENLLQSHLEGEEELKYPQNHFEDLVQERGEVNGFETGWVRPDGSVIFVREYTKAIKDEEGNVVYYEGIVEDITKERRAEERIKNNEKNMKNVFEELGDALIISRIRDDKKGEIIEVNDKAIEQLGYSREELIGKDPIRDLPVEQTSIDQAEIDKTIESGEPIRFQEVKHRKDGSRFLSEVTLAPMNYRGDRAVIAVVREIENLPPSG